MKRTEIAANVPPHWRDTAARMALECADTRGTLAETLLTPRSTKAG